MKKVIFNILNFKLFNYPILLCARILDMFLGKIKKIIRKIPVNRTFNVKINGNADFYIFSDGRDLIAKEIYWNGINSYETDTTELFTKIAGHSKCFFDIGANTGLFSLIACAIGSSNVQVHSFEPVQNTFRYLSKNKAVNNYPNLFLNNTALSNFEGDLTFYIPISGEDFYIPLGSSSRTDHLTELKKIKQTVRATKLDSYIESNNIKDLDFIKIDTEGTEHIVFEGGIKALGKFRPVIISEVLDGLNEPQMQGILDKFNYKYFNITNKGLVNKNLIKGDCSSPFKNYLFIQEEQINKYLSGINLIYQY